MKLNYKNLFELYSSVSVRKEISSTIKVQSLYDPFKWWFFSPKRLADRSKDVVSMLMQLSSEMMQSVDERGLPWFLAINRKDGSRWGDLEEADKLLAIGRAASMVKVHVPLTVCDVPFCIVLDEEMKNINLNPNIE